MRHSETSKDYYMLLGVGKDATTELIAHMYRIKARNLHPDLGGDGEEMRLLNEAYEVLKDAVSRRAYDDSRQTQYPAYGSLFGSSTPAPAHRHEWIRTLDKRSLGSLMVAGASFALGFFLVSEIGDRRSWPLRILSVSLMGVGVLLVHSVLRFRKHESGRDAGRTRNSFVTYEGLVLAIGFAALILFVTIQYVR